MKQYKDGLHEIEGYEVIIENGHINRVCISEEKMKDRIISTYNLLKSVRVTALAVGVSTKTVINTLCAAGFSHELLSRMVGNHTQE